MICLLAGTVIACAQTAKNTENLEQIWLAYFNQTRFSNKWGMWTDLHLRTKDDFASNFSQSIIRLGLTYYIDNTTKLTAGYARVYIYPDNSTKITRPEHRPWQQIQWHTNFRKTRLMQWIRLEERFRKKLTSPTELGTGYNFNWRVRYNIWYEVPLVNNGSAPKSFSFIANDELHINFGKEITFNYYDQNRLFLGFKYQFNKTSNLQFGYMNLFQQLGTINQFRNINAARIFFFQNFDLRKKAS